MKKCYSIKLLLFIFVVLNMNCSNENKPSMNEHYNLKPLPSIETGDQVVEPPEGVHHFYKKYINADGVIIVSSEKVPDAALISARKTVLFLLSKRSDIHEAMLKNHPRISIMAHSETASDLPDFGPSSDGEWGLGQMPGDPTTLVSERGIWYPENSNYRANFLLHEFVHMMHNLGMPDVEPEVLDEIYNAYLNAIKKRQFTPPKDEPLENITPFQAYGDDEYFTHAVNAWYDLNESLPGPWMDVKIGEEGPRSGTREELKNRDPAIYAIIKRYFPENEGQIISQHRQRR